MNSVSNEQNGTNQDKIKFEAVDFVENDNFSEYTEDKDQKFDENSREFENVDINNVENIM